LVAVALQVFYREQAALMYDPYVSATATILCELPYSLVQTSIFVPIVYWMVGFQPDAAKFFFYFLVVFVNLTIYTSFSMFLIASTSFIELAHLISSAMNFIFNIFNGEFGLEQPSQGLQPRQ
jgi:ABC-type multidrug transport system permease subunit